MAFIVNKNYENKTLSFVNLLNPKVKDDVIKGYNKAKEKEIQFYIYCSIRTPQEQAREFAKGRTIMGIPCNCPEYKIKKRCSTHPLGLKVTDADAYQSYHNYGLAFDFALIKDGSKVTWNTQADLNNNHLSDWLEVIKIFKEMGWESGIDFKSKDAPHLQKRFGLNWKDLKKMSLAQNTPYVSIK